MFWLVCIGILAVIITLIMVSTVNMNIYYRHHRHEDTIVLRFRLWGINMYTYKIPGISFDEQSASVVMKQEKKKGPANEKNEIQLSKDDILRRIRSFHALLSHIYGFSRIVRHFFSKMKVRKFVWHTQFGLGDAAATGSATGSIWAVKGNVIGLLDRFFQLQTRPEISVVPLWQGEKAETELQCMISFRIGHAMGAGSRIVKYWKGR
ncbi:MAG TPA: DUF2953 domain-containing protein [Bacillales bacterium]|nr:DUF2953 domain-containing protein [Bacillales bacterium]